MVTKSLHRSVDLVNSVSLSLADKKLIKGCLSSQSTALLRKAWIATRKDKILLSISGGQDSICLLVILNQLCAQMEFKLGLVWCHHLWQVDSFSLMRQITKISYIFQLNSCFALTPKPIYSELLARNWRHDCSARICLFYNYYKISLAHSASDKTETILLNLMRGTGVAGLSPLSWKTKSDVQKTKKGEHLSQRMGLLDFFFIWSPFYLHKEKKVNDSNLAVPTFLFTYGASVTLAPHNDVVHAIFPSIICLLSAAYKATVDGAPAVPDLAPHRFIHLVYPRHFMLCKEMRCREVKCKDIFAKQISIKYKYIPVRCNFSLHASHRTQGWTASEMQISKLVMLFRNKVQKCQYKVLLRIAPKDGIHQRCKPVSALKRCKEIETLKPSVGGFPRIGACESKNFQKNVLKKRCRCSWKLGKVKLRRKKRNLTRFYFIPVLCKHSKYFRYLGSVDAPLESRHFYSTTWNRFRTSDILYVNNVRFLQSKNLVFTKQKCDALHLVVFGCARFTNTRHDAHTGCIFFFTPLHLCTYTESISTGSISDPGVCASSIVYCIADTWYSLYLYTFTPKMYCASCIVFVQSCEGGCAQVPTFASQHTQEYAKQMQIEGQRIISRNCIFGVLPFPSLDAKWLNNFLLVLVDAYTKSEKHSMCMCSTKDAKNKSYKKRLGAKKKCKSPGFLKSVSLPFLKISLVQKIGAKSNWSIETAHQLIQKKTFDPNNILAKNRFTRLNSQKWFYSVSHTFFKTCYICSASEKSFEQIKNNSQNRFVTSFIFQHHRKVEEPQDIFAVLADADTKSGKQSKQIGICTPQLLTTEKLYSKSLMYNHAASVVSSLLCKMNISVQKNRNNELFVEKNLEKSTIRPLLALNRFDVKKLCIYWELPVYPDQSNKKMNFLRNRVRKQLLPTIKLFFNSRIENVLLQFSDIFSEEDHYMNQIITKLFCEKLFAMGSNQIFPSVINRGWKSDPRQNHKPSSFFTHAQTPEMDVKVDANILDPPIALKVHKKKYIDGSSLALQEAHSYTICASCKARLNGVPSCSTPFDSSSMQFEKCQCKDVGVRFFQSQSAKKMVNIFSKFEKFEIEKKEIYWPIIVSFLPKAIQRRFVKLFLVNQNLKQIQYSQIEQFLSIIKKF